MESIPRVSEATHRLKEVFSEIPGTRLTAADAVRLSGLDRFVCEQILVALEDAQFLTRGPSGLYRRRASDSPKG